MLSMAVLCSSRFNPVWEFPYTIGGQPCDMVFTSVSGHLMEMDFEDAYRKWHGVNPVELYSAPMHKRVPEVRHYAFPARDVWPR